MIWTAKEYGPGGSNFRPDMQVFADGEEVSSKWNVVKADDDANELVVSTLLGAPSLWTENGLLETDGGEKVLLFECVRVVPGEPFRPGDSLPERLISTRGFSVTEASA